MNSRAVRGVAIIFAVSASVATAEYVAHFSAATAGTVPTAPWRATKLPKVPRETQYQYVEDDGTVVVRAVARGSMSGLSRSLKANPLAMPMLEWRWKVSGVPPKGDVGTRAGDDYAARLYVLFDYDLSRLPLATRLRIRLARTLYGEAVPAAGLCYVWDAKARIGTTAWSGYTDRLRMIVVESGPERAGQWVTFRRNVVEDYRAAFGEDPPAISGFAVATDTDNTGAEVTAWYGDIQLGPGP